MKTAVLKYTILSWVSGLTMLILLAMPFHALLTVWGSSILDGHYITLRLWKEVLLVICIIGTLYLIATDHKIRTHTLSRRLVWLILAYMLLNVVWGFLALVQHDVGLKALGYGLIINLRFLAFFLVTWALSLRMSRLRSHWQWMVYWPAMGVAAFGLLQVFVLPHDFLRHFGYGPLTIPAFETINNNEHYIRIASTLRGANPLGAYLLIPISLLVVLLLGKRRTWLQAGFLLELLVVLFFTFSRSAWIGAALSIGVILLLSIHTRLARRVTLAVIAGLVIAGAGITAMFHNNARFENFVFHTETNSTIPETSNEGHLAALENGVRDLERQPLGHGPGTAGPASIYNTEHAPRLSENYFIQITQELGWVGLTLFVLINVGVGYLLWIRRADPLALSLFASLIGLTFINLLSHAWTDDTLAYVWWGLAGVAMAPDRKSEAAEKAEREAEKAVPKAGKNDG